MNSISDHIKWDSLCILIITNICSILIVRWEVETLAILKSHMKQTQWIVKRYTSCRKHSDLNFIFLKLSTFIFHRSLCDIYDAMLTGRHKELQIWILKVWTIVLLNFGRNTYASTLVKFVITESHWHSWSTPAEKCFLVCHLEA